MIGFLEASNGVRRRYLSSRMTEFVDAGTNFGLGKTSPAIGVKPELPLIRALVLRDSENKKPMMSVYLRHEYGTMEYEKFSIREIDPL